MKETNTSESKDLMGRVDSIYKVIYTLIDIELTKISPMMNLFDWADKKKHNLMQIIYSEVFSQNTKIEIVNGPYYVPYYIMLNHFFTRTMLPAIKKEVENNIIKFVIEIEDKRIELSEQDSYIVSECLDQIANTNTEYVILNKKTESLSQKKKFISKEIIFSYIVSNPSILSKTNLEISKELLALL